MASIDPTTMAQTLISAERYNMDQLLSTKASTVSKQLTGLSTLSSKLSTFQTLLKDLNKVSTLQAQSSTMSQDGYMSVTSDGTASAGQYNFFVQQLAQAHQLAMSFTSETQLMPSDGTLSLQVNGQSMALDLSTLPAGATLKDLVTAINADSTNPGVQASLVRADGQIKLMLTSKETGVANAITVNYTPLSGGSESDTLAASISGKTEVSQAKDAIVKMGTDSTLTITSSSNKLTNVIDGLTIQLTKAQTAGETPISLTVGQDTDAVTEALQKFVDGYNSLITDITGLTSRSGDTKGALAGDSSAKNLINILETKLRQLPGGMTLSSLGITTDRYGKIALDTSALQTSLENDPTVLTKALQGDTGLLKTLQTATEAYTSSRTGIIKLHKDNLEREQDRISDKQTALDERMDRLYQRYLAQFTQLNSVMSQMEQTTSMFA